MPLRSFSFHFSIIPRRRSPGPSLPCRPRPRLAHPKHIYHSIICIGALVAHQENGHWVVGSLGAPHVGERTEKALISSFVDRIARLTPQLVIFNGSSFDLPVLRYRAMVHGVAAPGLSLYRDGRIRDIAEYCESDIVNTYRVWLRYELFRGRLSDPAFQASEDNLIEFIKAQGNTKPHLADLV
jgi:3'-5' exonuclease